MALPERPNPEQQPQPVNPLNQPIDKSLELERIYRRSREMQFGAQYPFVEPTEWGLQMVDDDEYGPDEGVVDEGDPDQFGMYVEEGFADDSFSALPGAFISDLPGAYVPESAEESFPVINLLGNDFSVRPNEAGGHDYIPTFRHRLPSTRRRSHRP